jgi:hypothetical protein
MNIGLPRSKRDSLESTANRLRRSVAALLPVSEVVDSMSREGIEPSTY